MYVCLVTVHSVPVLTMAYIQNHPGASELKSKLPTATQWPNFALAPMVKSAGVALRNPRHKLRDAALQSNDGCSNATPPPAADSSSKRGPEASDMRLTALESSMQEIIKTLKTIKSELVLVKEQSEKNCNATISPMVSPAQLAAGQLSGLRDGLTATEYSAQERLESVIKRTHGRFAKYDSDGSGSLDVSELTKALNSLGTLKSGRELTDSVCADILSAYDGDKSRDLDRDEFALFVTDLVSSGEFTFRDELQEDVKLVKSLVDDPWISAKQDRDVRSMMDSLRDKHERPFRRGSIFSPRHSASQPDLRVRKRSLVSRSCCCACRLLPIINPDGRLRSIWNALMAALIVYCAAAVPLEVAFEPAMVHWMGPASWTIWGVFNLAVDGIFIFDLLISFRTSYFVEGHLQRDGSAIALNYLRGGFVTDLIGSFPLYLVFAYFSDQSDDPSSAARLNRQLRLIRIAKLNRMLRLSRLTKKLKYLELLVKFNPGVLRVAKVFVMLMLVCHWIGCAWWFISDMELSGSATPTIPQNVWQPSEELLTSNSLSKQFAAAFLWGAAVATAMLPFDIEPDTEVEQYFTVLCMLWGLVLNAYVIGSIASALSTMDSKKALARGKIETIAAYLQINAVSPELKANILEFYEYLYTSTQTMSDLRLYQDLPPALATRLAVSVHRRLLARCPALRAVLSDNGLLAVLGRLKPRIYVPGQIIFAEGQVHSALVFLKKGRVHLIRAIDTQGEEVVRVLGQYDNFGLSLDALHDEESQRSPKMARSKARRSSEPSVEKCAPDWSYMQANPAKKLEVPQEATETAKTMSYCDAVSLDHADLISVISKDWLWTKLHQESNKAETLLKRRGDGNIAATVKAALFARKLKENSARKLPALDVPRHARVSPHGDQPAGVEEAGEKFTAVGLDQGASCVSKDPTNGGSGCATGDAAGAATERTVDDRENGAASGGELPQ